MSAVEAGEARTLLRWVARLMAADPMWRSLYPLTEFSALCAAAKDGELLTASSLRRWRTRSTRRRVRRRSCLERQPGSDADVAARLLG